MQTSAFGHRISPYRLWDIMIAFILCLLPILTTALSPSAADRTATHVQRLARDQQAMLPSNVAGANQFQQSYKVSSVFDDPFYNAPSNSSDALAGSVLKVERETNTSRYTIPPTLSLSRFLYQSKTSNGTLVPVSGFLLWPYAARAHAGSEGIPVVAWAHGTSGTSPECAPSNVQNLWYHFQGLFILALQGYAVVATDYAGLGVSKDAHGNAVIHEYLTAPAQANDVYYSVIAARKAFPGLSQKFVAMGHSEGGGAAWSFAEKLAKEPLTGYLGTVALSPFTRFLDLPPDEPIIPAILLFLVPNLQTNYGPFAPEDIFTPKGIQSLQLLDRTNGFTTVVYQITGPGLLKPGWQNNTSLQKFQQAAANGGKELGGPFLVLQGGADPIIYPPTVEAGINETLQKFPASQIEFHLLPNVTHTPTMYAGLPIYLNWINARLDGEPAPPGYREAEASLARPLSSLQSDANWFIQKQLEPYQMT